MRADILFLGVDGFDLEAGLTTPNLLQSRLNRTMVGRSPRGGACDLAKFERRSLFQTVPLYVIHCVITGGRIARETAEGLRGEGIELGLV